MIYSVVTTEYGRVEDIKTFEKNANAMEYFKVQCDLAKEKWGSPDEDNANCIEDIDYFGESEAVFAYGDCRVFFETHALN